LSSWKHYKLKDIADIKLSNVDKKIKDNEIPIKLCNYTDVYKNSFINFDKAKNFMVASCNKNEYKKFKLQKGQVAITKDSETPNDIGISTYILENFDDVVLGYHLSLITPNQKYLNGRFLHYWFNTKHAKKYFENNAGGSGQRCSLSINIINNIPLFIPNITTQKAIAKVLSDIDAKIELNNKINRELEAMAKTLYDYWFVQFDFPNDQGKPYKSSGGKMIYNEQLKREIPKGWEVKNLTELFVFQKGIEPGTNEYKTSKTSKDDIVFYRVADINGNTTTYINSKNKNFNLINEYNVVVSFDGSIGKVGIGLNGAYSSGLQKIYDPSKKLANSIIYMLFKDERIIKTIHKYATGSIILHASNSIKYLTIPYDETIYLKFQNIINPIYNKIIKNKIENKQLTELRDWLLPMLMNGQVTVQNRNTKHE